MPHDRELSGVAHNIAHHAGSGLSYISPHLARVLRKASVLTTTIDMMSDDPYPPGNLEYLEPLHLSLGALKTKIGEILEVHGFSTNDVDSLLLHATPAPWDQEGYTLHTRVEITSKAQRSYDSGWLA